MRVPGCFGISMALLEDYLEIEGRIARIFVSVDLVATGEARDSSRLWVP